MNQTTRKPSEIIQLALETTYRPTLPPRTDSVYVNTSNFMCCAISRLLDMGMITLEEAALATGEVNESIQYHFSLQSYLFNVRRISKDTLAKYPFIRGNFYKGLIKRLKAQGK